MIGSQLSLDFDGKTFDKNKDGLRLAGQLLDVYGFMSDGSWHTLEEGERKTKVKEQSFSARLRDLRKVKFGGHQILRRRFKDGIFEYRMIKNQLSTQQGNNQCSQN